MSGAKEIRTKISSIKNTQKITKAMEMVAASKMRKAQNRMESSRPYADKIRTVIGHLNEASQDLRHPYLNERPIKRVGYIIVSTDRGLCGGLNTNLFRKVVGEMRDWTAKDVEMDFCFIGSKGVRFFRRFTKNIVGQVTHVGDKPHLETLIGTVKVMLDAYSEGRIDRLFLVHNTFVNTMTQSAETKTLLPVEAMDKGKLQDNWDYIYEPSPEELLGFVVNRYIESQVYRGVVENTACEMAARMVAMKSATDNAGNLIEELQLVYNKARQAAITQEISEIVSGAAAV